MKIGIRKPSFKKSLKARTTGKLKRKLKKSVNPLYGKKGMGWVKNPKKALYNKVYNKTSVSAVKLLGIKPHKAKAKPNTNKSTSTTSVSTEYNKLNKEPKNRFMTIFLFISLAILIVVFILSIL